MTPAQRRKHFVPPWSFDPGASQGQPRHPLSFDPGVCRGQSWPPWRFSLYLTPLRLYRKLQILINFEVSKFRMLDTKQVYFMVFLEQESNLGEFTTLFVPCITTL